MITKHWPLILDAMKSGGYYDRVMSAGRELDRVKEYLLAFAGEREPSAGRQLQDPHYPCFPGLDSRPWYDETPLEGVRQLEAAFEDIRDEALRLPDDAFIKYNMQTKASLWSLYLFYHQGVNFESRSLRCPRTLEVLRALPGVCIDYPWGDALFSKHEPQAHLTPHCSVDNLRLRCHLGIQVSDECGIRVGTEIRGWEEGRCLLFDDSFEHEVWNRGQGQRMILIVDFWHPDLTEIEIQALTAGFRKADVRRIFMRERIERTTHTAALIEHLEKEVRQQEGAPLLRKYW